MRVVVQMAHADLHLPDVGRQKDSNALLYMVLHVKEAEHDCVVCRFSWSCRDESGTVSS